MKTLHLLRHAKSRRDLPALSDHDRPLAPRGEKAAKAMARHMKARGVVADAVFSSTAKRTRMTYDLVRDSLRGAPASFEKDLYLIETGDLLAFIRGLPDNMDTVMFVGHNPAFHELALSLVRRAGAGKAAALAALKAKYPTGALCSIRFNVSSWRKVVPGSGTLTGFIRPRELAARRSPAKKNTRKKPKGKP